MTSTSKAGNLNKTKHKISRNSFRDCVYKKSNRKICLQTNFDRRKFSLKLFLVPDKFLLNRKFFNFFSNSSLDKVSITASSLSTQGCFKIKFKEEVKKQNRDESFFVVGMKEGGVRF